MGKFRGITEYSIRLNDVLTKQHFLKKKNYPFLTVPYNTRFLHCTTHFEKLWTLKYIFESALNSGPSQRALNFVFEVLLYGRY